MKYLLYTIFFLSWNTFAQNVVTGKVYDEKTNQPLAGVHIINLNNNTIYHSGKNGTWRIRANASDTLFLTHVGYEPHKVIASEASNVALKQSTAMLSQVEISASNESPMETISRLDIELRNPSNSQEILRLVPGVFIAQHAGGGKAEQIFTRGFDIDHGTDLALNVDGMPVNMVSHAHGQGYADLHFLIPELVKDVNYRFGPHAIDEGNFATAGAINFETIDYLEQNEVNAWVGNFNTYRLFSALKLFESESKNQQFYIASEYLLNDGPFDNPQNYDRINIQGKYTSNTENSILSITGMYLYSDWNASGQIPPRAVENGVIGRFGSLDPTEGGETSRASIIINSETILNTDGLKLSNDYYISQYDFDLFSNFTFFLENPVYGDQIRQRENRLLYGGETKIQTPFYLNNNSQFNLTGGVGFRQDNSDDVSLENTYRRNTFLGYQMFGDIQETNLFAFVETSYLWKDLTISSGIRYDNFRFGYLNKLDSTALFEYQDNGIFSPKFKVAYNVSRKLKLSANYSLGFHSNDSRAILSDSELPLLPRANGLDLIAQWKPLPNLLIHGGLWTLDLESELVYVGDAGIVEPSGETTRKGIDFAARYDIIPSLRIDFDLNVTEARMVDAPKVKTMFH
ncbi:TonB-dependent receptor [Mangrovivirga cuniculi]|uniref:TonB-dependent receptor n=1 Tax=Mangrovivirga cuniculi TaxID=2715131 RepID=A0A4D7JR02_9BACT|nr:TonB-dependent receptor plug domain-containing protein [Mangrovivirga cuniculi]QCK15192.1 TonB-dependent receptor [Mangrovivirga cuniculi]